VSGLPEAFFLAPEVEGLLGRGEVLFRAMQATKEARRLMAAGLDSKAVQVVWFKRDLRVDDHAPLWTAAQQGPVLPLYVVEKAYWQQPDTSQRHQAFLQDALIDLDQALQRLGQGLVVMEGDAVEALESLRQRFGSIEVHAHEETGNGWTFARDKAIRSWAKAQSVGFVEYPQFGVVRGLQNRDRWASGWTTFMNQALFPVPERLIGCSETRGVTGVFKKAPAFDQTPAPERQPGGWRAGDRVLKGFLSQRGLFYRGGISSPNSAPTAASRLSAHIAYGTLSLRGIVHATRKRQQLAKAEGQKRWAQSLAAFERRLHWHCHFIQKLEQQPRLEFENMHRGLDGMRENDFNEDCFRAWQSGQTGYPLVDACMRSLRHTGWLTFRMRAMVTSFAAHHLWLHWKEPALHLARMFTDYEPGIHYNQIQMQSGTTGINATRIYNPVKQAIDQDPNHDFVRRWVPEWGGPDYVAPIVDHQEAARLARERMKAFRHQAGFREEAKAIYQALGSRSRRAKKKKKIVKDTRQASLFD